MDRAADQIAKGGVGWQTHSTAAWFTSTAWFISTSELTTTVVCTVRSKNTSKLLIIVYLFSPSLGFWRLPCYSKYVSLSCLQANFDSIAAWASVGWTQEFLEMSLHRLHGAQSRLFNRIPSVPS